MSTKSSAAPDYTGHRARLRERFMKEPRAVPDYEVLEMLLHLVIPRKDTKPLAKNLLEHFENIRAVAFSRDSELQQVPICGPRIVFLRTLIREIVSRCLEEDLLEKTYDSELIKKTVISRFAGLAHEELWILVLNSHHASVQTWIKLACGFEFNVSSSKKEIIATVLKNDGDTFVLVHNHPGGHPEPSENDRAFTSDLYWYCENMGVRMADHVIVGKGCCYSLLTEKIKGKPPKRI